MHKRLHGPFSELAALPDFDLETASDDDILDRMAAVSDALESDGCKPNGTCHGAPRDADFGDDISELVMRSSPHQIFRESGPPLSVRVKLETLQAEVDGEGEVVAWIYEES